MRWLLAAAILLPAALLLLLLLRIIHASRRQKMIVKARPMIGLVGIAETDLDPEGLALIDNEIWRAKSATKIECGAQIRVVAAEGVLLRVEKCR